MCTRKGEEITIRGKLEGEGRKDEGKGSERDLRIESGRGGVTVWGGPFTRTSP